MRYGKQPLPRTKAEFIAAMFRAEARGLRQAAAAVDFERRTGREVDIENLLSYARSRDEDAVYAESLRDSTAADRDGELTSLYKRVMSGLPPLRE